MPHITFVENFQLKIIFCLKLEILIYSSYLISEKAFKGTVVNRTFPSFYTLLKIHVNYSNFLMINETKLKYVSISVQILELNDPKKHENICI